MADFLCQFTFAALVLWKEGLQTVILRVGVFTIDQQRLGDSDTDCIKSGHPRALQPDT
jgi:hypothetical protein